MRTCLARRSLVAIVLVALVFPLAESRAQESDAQVQAEKLNDEGRERIRLLDLEGAAARFRAAMQLVRDPRYAFNLCYTLEKSGKLREARVACQDVVASGDERLSEKARGLLQEIDAKLADKEPVSTQPEPATTTTAPSPGDPNGEQPPIPPVKLAEPSKTHLALVLGVVQSDVSGDFESRAKTGFAGGGALMFSTYPSIKFIAEVQLVQRGFETNVAGLGRGLDVSMTYLDVGGSARYELGQSETIKPYLELGPVFSILLTDSVSLDGVEGEGNFQSFDVAWGFGAGVQMGVVDVRIRYLLGLFDIAGDSAVDGGSSSLTHQVTMFQGAFWF